MGDTTSPASNLGIASWQPDELDFILQFYGADKNPCRTCPASLFAEIIKLNDLRARTARRESGSDTSDLTQEGYTILSHVYSFHLEQWVDSKPPPLRNEWLVLGDLHQAAVALYCIHSLQSLSLFPDSEELSTRCRMLGRRLQFLLDQAIASPRMRLFVLWPLVVLGVEALNGGEAMRTFVEESMLKMSHHIGSYAPMVADAVLRKFWGSGERRWDACFDQPYIFLAQTAVDVSAISAEKRN
jgi:hypothetical protein